MWDLTSEQVALRERARELATEVIAPRAAEVDRTEQYPWDNVEALREAERRLDRLAEHYNLTSCES